MGRARRTELRETSVLRFLEIYETEIQALFAAESRNDSRKLVASCIREYLLKNYPKRSDKFIHFDIPSEPLFKTLSLQCSKEKKGALILTMGGEGRQKV